MDLKDSDLREHRAPEGPEMISAMRRGVVEALREHKHEGRSVVTWDRENQQIVEVLPDEIVIPDDREIVDQSSAAE